MKKLIFIAVALLLFIPWQAWAAEDCEVLLPADYADSGLRYPVLYVLPQAENEPDDSGLAEALALAMEQQKGLPMIIVRPSLSRDSDIAADMAKTVAAVDGEYRTIPDRARRAAVGTGAGGYLAYMLALEDGSPFGAAVSVRGNFTGEDSPWLSLGSAADKIRALHSADKTALDRLYTYLDAPVEDAWTDQEGSSDDIGAMMIGFGTGSAFHEYTARPGAWDEAFLAESSARVLDRLTRFMLGDAVSASLSPVKAVLTDEDETLSADYTVTVSDALRDYAPNGAEMELRLAVGGQEASETQAVNGAGEYSGRLSVKNALAENAEAQLTVSLLGAPVARAAANLILQKNDPGALDLSGDWHFLYAGGKSDVNPAALTAADFADWPIVQPGMGNWTKGYGNISDENVRSSYGPDYFDFFITGNGYYARVFTVPEDFSDDAPELSIGCVDDRCEVFLNGVRVGATGLDEKGQPTGDTTWAVFSHFTIDPGLLKRDGENVLVVRAWNDLPFGAGGWYAGPIGLYTQETFASRIAGDNSRFYEETFASAFAASAQGQTGEAETPYLIYLPPDYAQSDRRYPTVYLLHQFNSDHTSYRTDRINELLDAGIAEGRFDPMIVVIPNSAEESWWRGDWEKMITQELIPHIDSLYRTIPDARYRLTAGCSMGGQGAFGVALRNPDFFSGAVSFFGAFSYGAAANPVTISRVESAEYLRYFTLCFICGNQDNYGFGVPAIELHQELLKKDVPHRFFIENGSHDSAFYLPFFQDAFSYARANMYHAGEAAAEPVRGTLAVDQEKRNLTIDVRGDETLKDLMLTIPASVYTVDPSPALRIPVTLEISQDGQTVYSATVAELSYTAENSSVSATLALDEMIDPAKPATMVLKASLFDQTTVLDTLDDLTPAAP